MAYLRESFEYAKGVLGTMTQANALEPAGQAIEAPVGVAPRVRKEPPRRLDDGHLRELGFSVRRDQLREPGDQPALLLRGRHVLHGRAPDPEDQRGRARWLAGGTMPFMRR